jgi:glycolate oxidase iron-sulfur subunit
MVEMATPQARSSASLLALADQCVQCGLCLPHCPTYRLDATETESPRGRIAYMKALADGQLAPTEAGDRHLDHCLGCRRCESVCPAGVQYGALLAGSRARQFDRAPPPMAERFRRQMLASPGLLNGLLSVYRRLHPLLPATLRPLPRPPAAVLEHVVEDNSPTAIFVGCVAASYESPARAALLRLLAAVGAKVSIPDGQTCCGTAAVHAGDHDQADRLAEKNRAAFAGKTRVLSLASGCQEILSTSLAGVSEVADAISFLENRAEALRFRSAEGVRVALHLPCTQRSVTRTDVALRKLLSLVPDLELVELPDAGCCGAAGQHMFEEPQRAAALRAPLLQSLANSGAGELLSANIGCRLHLANASPLRIRHPIEFLAEHLA